MSVKCSRGRQMWRHSDTVDSRVTEMNVLFTTNSAWMEPFITSWMKRGKMKSRNDKEWENNRERIRRGQIQPEPSRDKSGGGSLRQIKCVTKTYWTRHKCLRNLKALSLKDTCKDAFLQGAFHNMESAGFVVRDQKLDCAWMPCCLWGRNDDGSGHGGGVWIAGLLLSLTHGCACLHRNSLRLAIRYCLDR